MILVPGKLYRTIVELAYHTNDALENNKVYSIMPKNTIVMFVRVKPDPVATGWNLLVFLYEDTIANFVYTSDPTRIERHFKRVC